MKWHSKDRETMIDLEKVDYYHYDEHNQVLTLSVRGYGVVVRVPDVEDLYKKLTSQKEVI